jgi:hypothetical protein
MSDEKPRDEWLTPASDSRDETVTQQADELESFLAALLPMRAGNTAHPNEATPPPPPLTASSADGRLATMLIEVGQGIVPDSGFAAELQAEIERRIRDRVNEGARETGPAGEIGQPEADGNRAASPRATRPPSPLRRYRLLWAALAALLLLALLIALPPVQASLRRPLCLGSVCIVWGGSPHPATGGQRSPTPTPLPSVLDLAGRTTLAQARAQAGFPVRLPAYPADLGQPDYVFLQDLDGAAVLLVWVDHAHPDHVRMSLSELSSGIYAYKFATAPVAVTAVHGQKALWTTGPYMLELQNGSLDTRRLVTGHTLIWTEGAVTYRLETDLPLTETVRIAESLR